MAGFKLYVMVWLTKYQGQGCEHHSLSFPHPLVFETRTFIS